MTMEVLAFMSSPIFGKVQLELLYCPFGEDCGFKNPLNHNYSLTNLEKVLKPESEDSDATNVTKSSKNSNVIVRGELSVTVVAAEDLQAVDFMEKPVPFVVIMLKKPEAKSKQIRLSEILLLQDGI